MKRWNIGWIRKSSLILAAVALAAAAVTSPAAIFEHEVKPRGNDNFTAAKFKLWLPDDLKSVRGVLLLMPGWQSDGRGMAQSKDWQKFARDLEFGILAGSFQSSQENRYDVTPKGSGKAVLDTLTAFSKEANHPELANAPLALWGHSAGGQFAYSFAGWKPQRVLAFVAVKGGVYVDVPRGNFKVMPALFCAGEKDQDFRIKAVTGIVTHNRQLNAPWCLFVEPNAHHEVGKTTELARPFLKESIALRLGPPSPFGSAPLKNVHAEQGWLINPQTGEAAEYAHYTGSKSKAVWVPSEAVATVWKTLSGK